MSVELDSVFKAIRQACSPNQWSRAVELVRAQAVSVVRSEDEQVVCRVRTNDHVVPPTVTLHPEDEEWECSCTSKAPCCEHVAAAIIALRKAETGGAVVPTGGDASGALLYRFRPDRGHLVLERWVTRQGGQPEKLTGPITSKLSQPERLRLAPTDQDLAIDRLMGAKVHGPLGGAALRAVLQALAEGSSTSLGHIELDGEPVTVAARPLLPRARVQDHPRGLELTIETSSAVARVLVPGVARVGGVLHVLGETELTGESLERLPQKRVFGREEWAELATVVVVDLSKRIEVAIETKRLPKIDRSLKPELVLEVEQAGAVLTVLPKLMYGKAARVDGGKLVHLEGGIPVRDEDAERREQRRLRDALGLSLGVRAIVSGDAAAELARKLDSFSGRIEGRAPERFIHKHVLAPQLDYSAGRVSLQFNDERGRAVAAGPAVLTAWQEGHSLVPLLEGGFAPLPTEWLAQHGHRVAALLSLRPDAGEVELPKHAMPALAETFQEMGQELPGGLAQWQALLSDFAGLPKATLPGDLTAELRDYQRVGVDWLVFLRNQGLGGILADDMGLGKTLQALTALTGRALVVCPRSVLENWQREARRFRPSLRVSAYHGPGRKLDPNADLTLTTYAVMRLDQDVLSASTWDAVVLDEAQTIKNPDSQVTQAAHKLRAKFRLTLSGTPVENRLEELWSQLHFVNPGLLGSRQFFEERYAGPIGVSQPGAAQALRARVRPFVLRRLKEQVATELPPRTDLVRYSELDEQERAVYDSVRAATQKEIVLELQQGGSVLKALEALLRLRQAACHSALLPGQSRDTSSKTQELLTALDEAATGGHKALVFSQWTRLLDLLEPHLRAAGIRFLRLDGSTVDRQSVVDQFQVPSGPEVLLLSLKAGGTGLNLTAADHVFLMDPWWNPAAEDQAADRAHRIGQDRPVFVHRMVARDTVEERILELQERKRALAEAALGNASGGAALTRDDLMALLQ